ncbi:hypothetical protein O181_003588 [Austropuccinia psidii MF-1]|uniref:HAT C-terminal dimerisation domain-containing protein n=1 Tax=Austropuccinia psidii MF-1 TaxID=1389203 RepID=A0A9Q3BEZ1_9BASI|nr:hypothetical protein [Austropuccinia psidii MF-1]
MDLGLRRTRSNGIGSSEKTIVQQLRDLFLQIQGSAKQQDLFIQAWNKTRDRKLLPIKISITRWNYFLKQIQWEHQIKLSIQIYTSSPQTMKYQLFYKAWCAIEYMEPILSIFEKTCNIFQSNAPTKHFVLPYYQGLLTWLDHYYQESIFKQPVIPLVQSKQIIDKIYHECATLNAHVSSEEKRLDEKLLSDEMSDPESFSLLNHLQQIPIETNYKKVYSQYDEVGKYLQNLNPIVRGEQVIDYWKVSNWFTSNDFHFQHQILSGHFPNLGKITFKYFSIPSSSASVECVFSHSGCLESTKRASPGSRTIAHLTCLKEWLNNDFLAL